MNRIIRDFLRAELRALLLLLLLIAAMLAYLIYWAGLRIECALVLPLLAVLLALRAWRSVAAVRAGFEALPLNWQERIAREYAAPHPSVPIYQGEAHLLSSCMICRSRRMLLLFPAESVAAAAARRYSGRNRIIASLLLTCNNGKSYRLEFLGRQKASLQPIAEALRAWGVPFEGDPQ